MLFRSVTYEGSEKAESVFEKHGEEIGNEVLAVAVTKAQHYRISSTYKKLLPQ